MSESTELAVKPQQNTGVATQQSKPARFTQEQIEKAQITDGTDMPAIVGDHIKPSPIGLSVEYWSPEKEGESKNVWVLGIEPREVVDMETGETKVLDCVLMVEQTADKKILRFYSASKILVGTIESAIRRNEIIPGTLLTPCRITYTGLKRTKTGRNAARWEINPLVVSVQ